MIDTLDSLKTELNYRTNNRDLKALIINDDSISKSNLILSIIDIMERIDNAKRGKISVKSYACDCSKQGWEIDIINTFGLENDKEKFNTPEDVLNSFWLSKQCNNTLYLPIIDTTSGVNSSFFGDWKDILYAIHDTDTDGILAVNKNEFDELLKPENSKYKSRAGSFLKLYASLLGKYL